MKKLVLLVMVFLVSAPLVCAQSPVRYQGEVDAGYSVGVGALPVNRANIHLINGVRVGDYVSAGVGLGVDIYHKAGFDSDMILPVFLNLKGYLPVQGFAVPFLSLDLGAGIGLSEGLSGMSGLLCTPAIGCAFKMGHKNAMLLSLGYNIQQLSESGASISLNAVAIKVGFQF